MSLDAAQATTQATALTLPMPVLVNDSIVRCAVLSDEAIEGTSVEFGSHQWKPNAVAEPPV